MVIVVHLYGYTKHHRIIHFKNVNCMVRKLCELYLKNSHETSFIQLLRSKDKKDIIQYLRIKFIAHQTVLKICQKQSLQLGN